MKLYAKNNIVRVDDEVYFIEIVGERLRLNDKKRWGISVDNDSFDAIKDIEMSDWLLDNLFKRHYYNKKEFHWVVDSLVSEGIDIPYFKIENCGEGEDCYALIMGGKKIFYFDSVRELQNAYHFYRDYQEGDFLNEDIDEKIKKLFKLI